MFTAEIRINGGLIATLHVHNVGTFEDVELFPYNYEYYEPEVGIRGKVNRNAHVLGNVYCSRKKGLRHVLYEIFKDLDSKE
jgi:hypothetical protein